MALKDKIRITYLLTLYLGTILLLNPTLLIFANTESPISDFSDVPKSHWAYTAISYMKSHGFITGYEDKSFLPDKILSRAEFACIMSKAFNLEIHESDYTNDFADVYEGTWYFPYVLSTKNYLKGFNNSNGIFYYPDSPALRENVAVAVSLYKEYISLESEFDTVKKLFKDWQEISSDSIKHISLVIKNKIMSGDSEGTFRPKMGLTRAEASAILYKAMEKKPFFKKILLKNF